MRVVIDSIAAGGDGVGRLEEGVTVFVPRTTPGDVVEVRVTVRKRRWARAQLVEIVEPGGGRVRPRCRHYVVDECGGCQLQHLTLDAQREAKRRIVGEALRRIGGLRVEDPPVRAVGEPWRYRRKVTFSVRAGGTVGFRRLGEPDRGFVVEDCCIADEALMTLWRAVRDVLTGLPGLRAVTLRLNPEDGRHVIVTGATAGDVRTAAASIGSTLDVSWWVQVPGRPVRRVAGRAGGAPLAFEQANSELAEQIRRDAVTALAPPSDGVAWDLYGGAGHTARLLAEEGTRVWSVDRDREAIAHARRHRSGSEITYVAGGVEEALPTLPPPDCVVLNPPRRGLGREVAGALNRWAAESVAARRNPRIAYISCDPATLARDLSWMPNLPVRDVATYDLFPQTSHIETLVIAGPAGGVR